MDCHQPADSRQSELGLLLSAGGSSARGPSQPTPSRPARADPVTINPMATADRLQKAPGPLRPQPLCDIVSREHSLAPSLFSSMDNGHVDWSFPRQGSYGSLSSAAHMARVRPLMHSHQTADLLFSIIKSSQTAWDCDGSPHVLLCHK